MLKLRRKSVWERMGDQKNDFVTFWNGCFYLQLLIELIRADGVNVTPKG